jgi:very-short-patch-repair endonuclease
VWAQLSVLAAGGRREGLTPEWLVAIGDFLVSGARTETGKAQPLCSIAELDKAARLRRGKCGAKLLSSSLPLVRTGVDSPKETELRLGLVAAGLPEPEIQLSVMTAAGKRHADLGYRDARVLLEFQGDEHRVDRRRWMDDLTRVQLFEDAGYRVMLVADADLTPDCRALASRIRRVLDGTAFGA